MLVPEFLQNIYTDINFSVFQLVPKFLQNMYADIMARRTAKKLSISERLICPNLKDLSTI